MNKTSDVRRFGFPSEAEAQFPSCVQLTLVHYICDCACMACPVGRLNRGDAQAKQQWERDGAKRGWMTWEVFEKAARETGQYPNSFLRLHGRGEPTLHPRFVEMIAFAKAVGVRTIQAFTNGLSMDAHLARGVLQAGLDVLEFSIHGHVRTYAELMGYDHFERVVENVLRFVWLRDEAGYQTKVVVSAVDQPGFQVEKDAHHQFWAGKVDQVILRPYHSWGGRIPCEVSDLSKKRQPCPQFWTRLTVGPTGRLLFCFNSWEEKDSEVVADLMKPGQTIADAWQSPAFTEVRRAHLASNYTLRCCAECTDWTGSSWGSNSYEALLRRLEGYSPEDNG